MHRRDRTFAIRIVSGKNLKQSEQNQIRSKANKHTLNKERMLEIKERKEGRKGGRKEGRKEGIKKRKKE